MISYSIKGVIPTIQNFLAKQPVERAWLFGSCSRGEETAESDIDIMVQYKENERVTLLSISHIRTALAKLLNRRVDLVEEDGLLPFAQDSANHDRILIYERKN